MQILSYCKSTLILKFILLLFIVNKQNFMTCAINADKIPQHKASYPVPNIFKSIKYLPFF